jgi:hypothetical protein
MLQNRLVFLMHEGRIDGSLRNDTVRNTGRRSYRLTGSLDQIEIVMSKNRGMDMRNFGAHPYVARGKIYPTKARESLKQQRCVYVVGAQ